MTWTNTLIDDDAPITWVPDGDEQVFVNELAGRLVFGCERQLVIDMCGTAATELLRVLVEAHRSARVRLPAGLGLSDGPECPCHCADDAEQDAV